MKIYASSYRIGSDHDQLGSLRSDGGKMAVVANALDFSDADVRRQTSLYEMAKRSSQMQPIQVLATWIERPVESAAPKPTSLHSNISSAKCPH